MFIAALFAIAKIWKHPGIHQHVKCCIFYTVEYYWAVKGKWTIDTWNNMDTFQNNYAEVNEPDQKNQKVHAV